jgi:sugar phosphate isomerase/epimerase
MPLSWISLEMGSLTQRPSAPPIRASMKHLLSLPVILVSALTSLHAAGVPDDLKTNGFAIGCQAWTFNHFGVLEAIDKTAEAGGKVIELYPGQKLSADEPNVKFDHNASPEVWEKVKARLKEKNVTPIAYGVVGLSKDEAAARKVFEFAKSFSIRVINTESVDAIETIEKLVKEFDIKVGFHDHPKRPDDANYRMWDPNYILEVVKDRDSRIGACADTGHWVRSGLKPVDCLRILKGHIVSSHLKDLNAPLPSAHDVIYGTGVSDIPGILDEYRVQSFYGPISVEYEFNWDKNVDDAKQCIDFVRNYKTTGK